jgi:hypothetical protein
MITPDRAADERERGEICDKDWGTMMLLVSLDVMSNNDINS